MKLIENVPEFYTDMLYEFIARKLPDNYFIFKPWGFVRFIIRIPTEFKKKKVSGGLFGLFPTYEDYVDAEILATIDINEQYYNIKANPELKDILVSIIKEFEGMGRYRKDLREISLMIIDGYCLNQEFPQSRLNYNNYYEGT